VRFVRDAAVRRDPLFGAALDRRTARVPFEARAVTDEAFAAMRAALRPAATGGGEAGTTNSFAWTADGDRVAALKALSMRAWRIEYATPATHAESTRVTRIGAGEINAQPDGIALGGAMMELFGMAGLLTRTALDDPGSRAYRGGAGFYGGLIESTAAFGWLTTPANTRLDQLGAGADWVRINLAATRAGVAMHPLSQALQEFPAMAGPYRDVHAMLGVAAPAVIQGLFRFGHARTPPPSPRWPLEARLLQA
jgi:hypothetical protein